MSNKMERDKFECKTKINHFTSNNLRAFTVGSTIEPFGSIVEPNH
jgi:hypothetical protein